MQLYIEVAHAAVKDTNHPYYANKFNKISKRRGKKRAYIAIGDPEVVPAGSYAKEALTNLGVWDFIQDRLSLAGNVTEVLSQVETQNAEIGLVYETDAASSDKVEVVAECDNSLLATPVLYPIGRVSITKHKDEADSLIKFLKSDKALKVFKKYGFKKGE